MGTTASNSLSNNDEVCFYCRKAFTEKDEYFKVIIDGQLRRTHKRCYTSANADKTNIRIIMK